LLGTVFLLLVE